jgi:hypothetical protein
MDTIMTNTTNANVETTMATEPMTAVATVQPTQADTQVQVRNEDMVSKRFHKRELKKTKLTYGIAGAVAGAGGTLLVTKGVPALFRWTKAKIEAGKIKREAAKAAANQAQPQPEPAPAPENGAQQAQVNNQQAK